MLSRKAIRRLMESGYIRIDPPPAFIGPNSVDLHLGDSLRQYAKPSFDLGFVPSLTHGRVKVVDPVSGGTYYAIDPKNPPLLVDVPKLNLPGSPEHGKWLLVPGQFYLGKTLERTYSRGVVPHLDGRSTCGRLSIEAHKTAGVGDNGFEGRWTLEIEVTEPVLVSPGDRLFQVYFEPCWSESALRLFEKVHYSPEEGAAEFEGLLETADLYGGKSSHYQGSEEVRGAAPLD